MAEPLPVTLRGTTLGPGRPALCVPLVGRTLDDLATRASRLPDGVADVVEVRLDHLTAADDPGRVVAALAAVRDALPDDVPVLATFRTEAEGGERHLDADAYRDLLLHVVGSTTADAVDVEQFSRPDVVDDVVEAAHAAGLTVVTSSHDFDGTPSHDEIVSRLLAQQELGADVVKVAVTPRSPADVLTLLAATTTYRTGAGLVPAVTMAMGPLGVVSRLSGETFGSCLTFGSVGTASAPGQVDAIALRRVLELVHDAQGA